MDVVAHVGHHPQPMGPRTDPRRVVRRLCVRRRDGHVWRRARLGRRWLGPLSSCADRAVRVQAPTRPHPPGHPARGRMERSAHIRLAQPYRGRRSTVPRRHLRLLRASDVQRRPRHCLATPTSRGVVRPATRLDDPPHRRPPPRGRRDRRPAARVGPPGVRTRDHLHTTRDAQHHRALPGRRPSRRHDDRPSRTTGTLDKTARPHRGAHPPRRDCTLTTRRTGPGSVDQPNIRRRRHRPHPDRRCAAAAHQ